MPFLWIGRAEREAKISDKTDISEQARALQQVNDELRKKYRPVPGLVEIDELVQCEMDVWLLEWQQINGPIDVNNHVELAERWPDVMHYVNGRPLRQEAIAALVAIAEVHGLHQVVAIMDSFKMMYYSFDIIAEEPELHINWRVADF